VSETLAVAASNIRRLLRDTQPSNYAVDTPFEMYRTIVERAQALSLRAGVGRTVNAAYFTSVAGSGADIQLTSASTQMSGIFLVRDETYGRVLTPMSMPEIQKWRQSVVSTTAPNGIPIGYCIYESATNATLIRLNCIPTVAISYTVENELLVTTTYTAGKVLNFTDNFLRTIEKASALELGLKIPKSERERIELNDEVFAQWRQDIEQGVRGERQRKFNVQASAFGVGFFG
jgi:hypothetical protein